jgi:hypothetical protein
VVGLIRTLAEEYRYMGCQEEIGMDYWMFSLPETNVSAPLFL